MTFALSEDEEMIQKVVGEFARDQITLDGASELDRYDRFPTEHIAGASALGLANMSLPVEAGGAGITPTAFALALDEISQVCCNSAAVLLGHNVALRALMNHPARDAVVAAASEGKVLSLLVTEEATGARVNDVATKATQSENGFILQGQKVWGLGIAGASHALVLAKCEGLSLFLVPADQLILGQNESIMGLRASGIRTVYLQDVHVDKAALVGELGRGLDVLNGMRPWMQVGAASCLNGALAGGFKAAADFAESRVQFGKQIGQYQAVSDAVTDVDIKLHASRALTLQAAAKVENSDAAIWAARAKAMASEVAIWMSRKEIRVMGGTGFMREGGVERFARDIRAMQFLGEPEYVQRALLKEHLLDLAPSS